MTRLFKNLPQYLCIALVAGFFTLSGCTSDSLVGADLQKTHQAGKNGVGTQVGDEHNEGDKNGVGTQVGDEHNEGNKNGVGTQVGDEHNEG